MDLSTLVYELTYLAHDPSVSAALDYFAVLAGVLTGALFACERKLDIIGTCALGLVTGYGGGVIRDMLLQDQGVYFMQHPDLVLLCIVICCVAFYFRGVFSHLGATVFLCDALSVGLFAVAGVAKAVQSGEGVIIATLLGAVTAVGGGAIRDMCVGEIPGIFRQSNYYAVAGLAGSLAMVMLLRFGLVLPFAASVCVVITVMLRYMSVYKSLQTRAEADLTPRMKQSLGKLARSMYLHASKVVDLTYRRRR